MYHNEQIYGVKTLFVVAASGFYCTERAEQPHKLVIEKFQFSTPESIAKKYFTLSHDHGDTAVSWLKKCVGIEAVMHRSSDRYAHLLVGKTSKDRGNKFCAISIPYNSEGASHKRPKHPAFLQPFATMEYAYKTVIEVLPFIPVIPIRNIDKKLTKTDDWLKTNPDCRFCFLKFTNDLFTAAGLEKLNFAEDGIGVLPSGTPVLVYPNNASAAGNNTLNAFYDRYPAARLLHWTDAQTGLSRQETFFGNDYLDTQMPNKPQGLGLERKPKEACTL